MQKNKNLCKKKNGVFMAYQHRFQKLEGIVKKKMINSENKLKEIVKKKSVDHKLCTTGDEIMEKKWKKSNTIEAV